MPENSNTDESTKNTPRGDFNLLGVKKDRKPKAKVLLVIGGGVFFLFMALGVIFYFALQAIEANNPNKVDESKVKADAALAAKPVTDDDIQKKRAQILKRRQQEAQKKQEAPVPNPPQTGKANATAEPEQPSPAYLRKLSGGIAIQETGGGSSSQSQSTRSDADEQRMRSYAQAAPVTPDVEGSASLGVPKENTRGDISDLNGSRYAPTGAYLSPARKFLLKRKSNLRCALYTAVKTDHPGFVKCMLTQPLYSSDGSVIIAEAGAELDGEQKVEIRPGQTRVFTTWTDLETTAGVRASLNALGSGAMGESGTEAYVDNHYGERFGGAVMLSFIQDAFASAANATKRNDSTYSFDNSERNAENMATKALENSINIPPTGYVLPGTVINVIVAQDVNFSSVFKTRPVR
ncbi:TrbI/VirB10 family protein [Xenorhabdus budapestensis]|uniref:TrwE component of type IV secretion system n=1 Tax=Xenorhabdus budapestensis TaxID=290110 RepID=A0A2D0IT50_XENBU|nr:TrbI/VirB10 family protein [Xenorhabdus budapestensis]PHM25044.1 TrwE component of type IV secretion system [Xenorhabdus budapestensis]